MLTNRLFNLIVAAVLVVVVALAVQHAFATRAIAPETVYSESNEQALHESQLGERYGELPGYIDGFSPEQIQREYVLGERYGETPQLITQFSAEQIRREYWLGERYGVTP